MFHQTLSTLTQGDNSEIFYHVPERNFLLSITPREQLEFIGDLRKSIQVSLVIKNRTDSRQAFKVRCTCNQMFRIYPSIGILNANRSQEIKITYKYCKELLPNGALPKNNQHHFCIYHIPAPEYAYPVGVWQEHYGPAQGEKRIRVIFVHREESSNGESSDK